MCCTFVQMTGGRGVAEPALVRIDDRLIHGQVMAVWSKALGITEIVIAADDVAADPFMQKVMRAAAPPGVSVKVFTVEEAARYLQEAGDLSRTIVLLKGPGPAVQLFEAGFRYSRLNVGGIGVAPGRKKLYRNIAASPQEVEMLKRLAAAGVQVQFRIVPEDRPISLESVVK